MLKTNFFLWEIILIIFILSVTTLIRVLPTLNYNIPFTTDQGRDMLDLREIAIGHNIRLIGPTTSINGVYLGPFWYYFNLPAFIVGQGDPSYLMYWSLFWYQLAGFITWWVLRRHNLTLALFITIGFLFIPGYFYSSRYSWNANLMPPFTLLFLILLIATKQSPTKFKLLGLGLLSGLCLQIEAAFGVLFLPFTFIVLGLTKFKLKLFLYILLGFSITLLPQILFELKNSFIITKTFIKEITGQSQTLLDKLAPEQIWTNHLLSYNHSLHQITLLPNSSINIFFLTIIMYLSATLLFKKHRSIIKDLFLVSSGLIIFSFAFYLLYPYPLKSWYLLSLELLFVIIISIFLYLSISKTPKTIRITISFLLLLYIFISTYQIQSLLIPKTLDRSTDKSNLRNQLQVIDSIYNHSKNSGFNAYTYVASVYDFSYQYLYWWRGHQDFKYFPNDLSYSPNVSEYIIKNKSYLINTKPLPPNNPTYLIIEKDDKHRDNQFAWIDQFSHLCYRWGQSYAWDTALELKTNCPN